VIAAGSAVIMIDSTVELPEALAANTAGLADALVATTAPDLPISPPTPEIGFVHRSYADAEIYLVINTGPTRRTFDVSPRTNLRSYEQWDALWGKVLRTGAVGDGIELTLHPYDAAVVILTDESVKHVSAEFRPERRASLGGPWQVAYGNDPTQSVAVPHIWEDEPGRRHYSGAASYTTSIELDAVDGLLWIDFGDCEVIDGGATEHGLVGPSYRVAARSPVGEVAQVQVNGVNCGLAWAPPYRVEISNAVRRGTNEIKIIVYNTAANALAADEHIAQLAAESEARYGRRFRCRILIRPWPQCDPASCECRRLCSLLIDAGWLSARVSAQGRV
jgi:hypothetical protein